jgi:hypothetical protein
LLHWRAERDQKIIEKIPRIGLLYSKPGGGPSSGNFAIQGELCGHSILHNSMGFKKGKHHFYAFGIYDIDNQCWLPPAKTVEICQELNIDHAPVIACGRLRDFASDMGDLLQKAEGKGVHGKDREGLIFRALDRSFRFKVIANTWLLNYGKYKESQDQW